MNNRNFEFGVYVYNDTTSSISVGSNSITLEPVNSCNRYSISNSPSGNIFAGGEYATLVPVTISEGSNPPNKTCEYNVMVNVAGCTKNAGKIIVNRRNYCDEITTSNVTNTETSFVSPDANGTIKVRVEAPTSISYSIDSFSSSKIEVVNQNSLSLVPNSDNIIEIPVKLKSGINPTAITEEAYAIDIKPSGCNKTYRVSGTIKVSPPADAAGPTVSEMTITKNHESGYTGLFSYAFYVNDDSNISTVSVDVYRGDTKVKTATFNSGCTNKSSCHPGESSICIFGTTKSSCANQNLSIDQIAASQNVRIVVNTTDTGGHSNSSLIDTYQESFKWNYSIRFVNNGYELTKSCSSPAIAYTTGQLYFVPYPDWSQQITCNVERKNHRDDGNGIVPDNCGFSYLDSSCSWTGVSGV